MEIFTEEQLSMLSHVTKSTVDIEELEKTGVVTVNKIEENGLIQETIEYRSFDGTQQFKKVRSYYVAEENKEKINKINELINLALGVEDFEKAAKLRDKKQEFLKEGK